MNRDFDSVLIAPLSKAGKPFYITSALLAGVVIWSVFTFCWQYYWGLGETGMGHPVSWAFYLINFVFFIGISHAIAVSVHTVVSWVFGMQMKPMWHSTIFGPYFVAGAIYSGIAIIILVAAIARRVYHLEDHLRPIHFNNMGLLLLTMCLLWFYFTLAEYLTTVYGGGDAELAVFWAKFTGKYSFMFWAMVVLCFIVPLPILALKQTRTILGTSIASVCILIGMWLERFLIIIPTFSEPMLPYKRGSYAPSWVEWSLLAGLCAGFTLAFVLFSKLFPIVTIWETEKERKEAL